MAQATIRAVPITIGRARSTQLVAVALGLGLFGFSWTLWRVWPFTVDDALITLRYSRNLARHGSPVFNVGGLRAEGDTSFLWMVLMAIPHLISTTAVTAAKVTSVLCALGAAAIAYFTASRFTSISSSRHLAGVLAAGSFLILPATAIHAVSGMETQLFILEFAGLIYLTGRYVAGDSFMGDSAAGELRTVAKAMAFICLLLGLTRPEGNLLAVAALIAVAAMVGRKQRETLLRAIALWYIAPAAIYFAWRFSYYGHLFPLPYYAKVTNRHGVLAGLGSVKAFVRHYGLLGIPAFVGVLFRRRLLLPGALASLALLAYYLLPEPVMDYEARYQYPVVIFLTIAGSIGILEAGRWFTQRKQALGHLLQVGVALSFAIVLATRFVNRNDSIHTARLYGAELSSAHVQLGEALGRSRGVAGSRIPLLAVNDAGAIPYYSGWNAIDTWSLNDPNIAMRKVAVVPYVMNKHPDVLVLLSARSDVFETRTDIAPQDGGLYQAAVANGYQQMRTYRHDDHYYLWVMART